MTFRDRSSPYLRFSSFNKIVQIDRRDLIFTSTIEPFRQQTLTGRWTMTWETEREREAVATDQHFDQYQSYLASRTNIVWMRFFAARKVCGNWLSGKLKSILRIFAHVCSSVSSRNGERPDKSVYITTPTDLKSLNDELIKAANLAVTRYRFYNAQEHCLRSVPALRTRHFRSDDADISSTIDESNHQNHRVSPDRNPNGSRCSLATKSNARIKKLRLFSRSSHLNI